VRNRTRSLNGRGAARNNTFQLRLMLAVVDFLHRSGLSKNSISKLSSMALEKLREKPEDSPNRILLDSSVVSAIGISFHRWYREREFVRANGQPKPLKLFGGAPSVEALVRKERPAIPAATVAREMVRLRLVRRIREGFCVPTGMHALISRNHPYIAEHLAHSVMRLLSTVQSNARTKSGGGALFERYAHVPNLRRSQVQAFRDFSNQQGEALIDTTNDWLESHRRIRSGKAKTGSIEAGLHVFAYLGRSRISAKRRKS
jgi:hypothetical protein